MISPHYQQDLADKLARGQLALFLGADLPRAATGLPARAELAQGLAQRHGLDAGRSWAQTAQRAARGGFVAEVVRYLGDELEPPRRRPAGLHEFIVRLGALPVLTTAYDDLLKLAYERAEVALNHVVDDTDVPFIQAGRPTLLRLYGALSRRDSLVLTEDDQFALLRDRRKEALLGEVRAVLGKHTVLFLGYDLADPDFHFLWREVLERAGQFALGAYAAWPGLPEGERRVWEERRVRVLDVAPLALLEALVGARPALEEAGAASPEPAGRPTGPEAAGAAPSKPAGRPATSDWRAQRRRDLEEGLAQDLALLKEYEDTLRLSSDPQERARCRQKIEQLQAALAAQQREHDELGAAPRTTQAVGERSVAIGGSADGAQIVTGDDNVAQRGRYNVHIEHATGVVIGDGAQVRQQFESPAPPAATGPTTTTPTGSHGGGSMDYDRGFQALQEHLAQVAPANLAELATLQERFRKNERAERLFGSSENTRNERSQVIYALNELALDALRVSFNDLCRGVQP